MNRKLGLLVLLLFLCAQVFSLWHIAEHGFKKHTHNGQVCEGYLFCGQQGATSTPPVFELAVPVSAVVLILAFSIYTVAYDRYYHFGAPRAPPFPVL